MTLVSSLNSFSLQAGLHAYFAHKADEFGVYFFSPRYYETTEPFHASLRELCPRVVGTQLVASYFASDGMEDQFTFRRHSNFLVSVCKPGSVVKVMTGATGVIVSMINRQYGFIKFGAGEKALFCVKSLFKDGWQFSGDPLQLPAMKFDGYQVEKETKSSCSGEKIGHSWYAVLVWCGRRPPPQHCSTAEALNSRPVFREGRRQPGEGKGRRPSSSMFVGKVLEVRKDGAVVEADAVEAFEELVWVPGWRKRLANSSGFWLSTLDGECIGLGDLVAYYKAGESREGFDAVGRGAVVLKRSEGKVGRRKQYSEVGRLCDDSDSESDATVSDGELDWLEQDLGSMIVVENPRAKTMELLRSVHGGLQEVRGRGVRRRKVKEDMAGYTPLQDLNSFKKVRELMDKIEKQEYLSDEDPDYKPGDEVEMSEEEVECQTEETAADSSFYEARGRRKDRRLTSNSETSDHSKLEGRKSWRSKLPDWVQACSLPEVFDPESSKFVAVDR